jgi:hypothetical protein
MYDDEYFVRIYFEELKKNLPSGSEIDYFHNYKTTGKIIIYYIWGDIRRGTLLFDIIEYKRNWKINQILN